MWRGTIKNENIVAGLVYVLQAVNTRKEDVKPYISHLSFSPIPLLTEMGGGQQSRISPKLFMFKYFHY